MLRAAFCPTSDVHGQQLLSCARFPHLLPFLFRVSLPQSEFFMYSQFRNGLTALMQGALGGRTDCVRLLLAAGADKEVLRAYVRR